MIRGGAQASTHFPILGGSPTRIIKFIKFNECIKCIKYFLAFSDGFQKTLKTQGNIYLNVVN